MKQMKLTWNFHEPDIWHGASLNQDQHNSFHRIQHNTRKRKLGKKKRLTIVKKFVSIGDVKKLFCCYVAFKRKIPEKKT